MACRLSTSNAGETAYDAQLGVFVEHILELKLPTAPAVNGKRGRLRGCRYQVSWILRVDTNKRR